MLVRTVYNVSSNSRSSSNVIEVAAATAETYQWFGVFWGFIVLLVGSIAIYNKQCRDNRVACGGRRRPRRNQKKRHPGSVNSGTLSSTTSQATAVTIVSGNQVLVPIPQEQQQQQQQHHANVGVRPDSRMNQSTGLLSTTKNLDRNPQSQITISPTPAS
ncbi:hypothetical protein ElyMa_004799700 [Elysia marginata]|uniref:Uncharacterized protein n=1 Tax=Elysia marginata TaxID=1093978 RepID=A0AAV4IJZ8_9GAST|nr:hypothetical protein ElyMa_004799700 [Elysia marginata]